MVAEREYTLAMRKAGRFVIDQFVTEARGDSLEYRRHKKKQRGPERKALQANDLEFRKQHH